MLISPILALFSSVAWEVKPPFLLIYERKEDSETCCSLMRPLLVASAPPKLSFLSCISSYFTVIYPFFPSLVLYLPIFTCV